VEALPHFYMSGSFNAKTGEVPTVTVKYFARGGIINGLTTFVTGERGAEAIVPLSSKRMLPFSNAIADNLERRSGGDVVNNLYINDAQVNGDERIRTLFYELLTELMRLGRLQGAR
jgi:hypothetical protein